MKVIVSMSCILALALICSSCLKQIPLDISIGEAEGSVFIENIEVGCPVSLTQHERQCRMTVGMATIQELLEAHRWYRVFRYVVYGVMALGALLALIVSIRKHRLPRVTKTVGKAGLVGVFLYGLAVTLMLIAAVTAEQLPGSFWIFGTTHWLVICGSSAVAMVTGAIYVIRKTDFLETFSDQGSSVRILSVVVSVFGLIVLGLALWEGLLKHIPFIILTLLLMGVAVLLLIMGMGGLIAGLREEYRTPREKLAREIARELKKQRDDD